MKTLREISDSIWKGNLRIIGIPEGEEKENGPESLFKVIIAENFPNLGKEMEIHVKEGTRTPKYVNVETPTARHMVVKLAKVNDRKNIKGSKAEENKIQRNSYQDFRGFPRRKLTGQERVE